MVVTRRPHAYLGDSIHAIVAAEPSVEMLELDRYCRSNLAATKIPLSYKFVDQIPRNDAGKIQRAAVASFWIPAARSPIAFQNEKLNHYMTIRGKECWMPDQLSGITERVTDAFRRVLGKSDLDVAADFITAGGSSLLAVQAATIISEEFAVELSPLDIFDAPDLASVGAIVFERSSRR